MREHTLNNADTGGNITSSSRSISRVDGIAVQVVWDATTNGTFKVQGSIDNVHFDDIPGASVVIPGGAPGDFLFNAPQFEEFAFIQHVFTRAGGNGSLNSWTSGKDRPV